MLVILLKSSLTLVLINFSERRGLQECQLEVVRDCIPFTMYTSKSFKTLLDNVWSSIFCESKHNM